jgi:TonB family protein
MSNPPADSATLPPPVESWLNEPRPSDEGWTNRKFVLVLLFVLAVHVSLVFLAGTKKQIVPVPATSYPHLQLADSASELVALGDPTLFARPNAHDLVTAFWRQVPPLPRPNFDRPEHPHYLLPGPGNFGATFHEFVKNSRPGEFPLNFKPEPETIAPEVTMESPVPPNTTMQISDELAQRRLLHADDPPSKACNEVLKPSTVQALVDTEGKVVSGVVLSSSGNSEADQTALRLIRNLRFAPAPRLMFGEITFTWHTVPTNAVPAKTP